MTTGRSGIKSSLKKREQEAAAKKAREDQIRMDAEQAERTRIEDKYASNPGTKEYEQSSAEKKAGVNALEFEGVRDVRTGELLDQYKVDPFKGDASKKLRDEALGTGPSDWAKAALDRQKFEEGQGASRAGLQQQTAQSGAQSQLMRQGGLGSGGRLSLARSGARDNLMAQQRNASQGIQQRFGINETDAKRRQTLLGQTADVERGADIANIGTQKEGLGAEAQFGANRYNQQMQAWASAESAKAQRASGGGGGKCFGGAVEVQMDDGTLKKISDIIIGDKLMGGGPVLKCLSHIESAGFLLYDYLGTSVTGSHSVLERGEWKHVEDTIEAISTDRVVQSVFNLVTENHIIMANGNVFSDNVETNADLEDEAESLEALNVGFSIGVKQ